MTCESNWTTSVFLKDASDMEARAKRKSPARKCSFKQRTSPTPEVDRTATEMDWRFFKPPFVFELISKLSSGILQGNGPPECWILWNICAQQRSPWSTIPLLEGTNFPQRQSCKSFSPGQRFGTHWAIRQQLQTCLVLRQPYLLEWRLCCQRPC